MEAATHSHDHGPEIELNPATWRDAKRYAWLLGLVVPFAPFLAWASVEVTGFDFFWFFGPLLVFFAVNWKWGLVAATGALVPVSVVALAASWPSRCWPHNRGQRIKLSVCPRGKHGWLRSGL